MVLHAIEPIRDVDVCDSPQRAAEHPPVKSGKPSAGKCAQRLLLCHVRLQCLDVSCSHGICVGTQFLPEVNPQADYRGHEQETEDDVDAALQRSLARGFAHRRAHGNGLHFVVNGGERQSSQALRSEEHTSELQSRQYLVCRLLLEKKKILISWP